MNDAFQSLGFYRRIQNLNISMPSEEINVQSKETASYQPKKVKTMQEKQGEA